MAKLHEKIAQQLREIIKNKYVEIKINTLPLFTGRESRVLRKVWFEKLKENKGVLLTYKDFQGIMKLKNLANEIITDSSHHIKVDEYSLQRKLEKLIVEGAFEKVKNKNYYNYLIAKAKELIRNLKKKNKYIFFLKVFPANATRKFTFGNVEFGPLENLKEELRNITSKEMYEKWKLSIERFTKRKGVPSVWAKLEVEAIDDDIAQEIAYEMLNSHLNYLSIVLYNVSLWIGDGMEINRKSNIFVKNKNIFESSGIDKHKTYPLKLDNVFSNKIVISVDKIIREKNRNKSKNKLLTALYFFGEAMKEKDKHFKLLKLIVSLETLLLKGERDKKEKLKKKVYSIFVKNKAKNLEEVKSIVDEMYKKRSKLVHEGKKSKLTYLSLEKLAEIVRKSLYFSIVNYHKVFKNGR